MEQIYFTTITVNKWVKVFSIFPTTNSIILDSFKFLTGEKSVIIYAFNIMDDHLHIVWQIKRTTIQEIVVRFKCHTGNGLIKLLKLQDEEFVYNYFNSSRKDRKCKFWKIKSNNFLIEHPDIISQKINYTHKNPIRGLYKVVNDPSQYLYSSARSYVAQKPLFSFLTLWTQ